MRFERAVIALAVVAVATLTAIISGTPALHQCVGDDRLAGVRKLRPGRLHHQC
ncbi:hypothetical protein DFJ67_0685 [Asanoa ferruginea]|uniref:Uncharacterized protein n=1 Tax=Asanoa ferruginea TaxID=53367 RepID=A0A3D9ZE00_9ACTN|nr:hypothetical protein DFJ67_0685 [Asanoa ferruginea]